VFFVLLRKKSALDNIEDNMEIWKIFDDKDGISPY